MYRLTQQASTRILPRNNGSAIILSSCSFSRKFHIQITVKNPHDSKGHITTLCKVLMPSPPDQVEKASCQARKAQFKNQGSADQYEICSWLNDQFLSPTKTPSTAPSVPVASSFSTSASSASSDSPSGHEFMYDSTPQHIILPRELLPCLGQFPSSYKT